MPYPNETWIANFSDALTWVTQELRAYYAQMTGYLGVEHKEDGTHSAITADSITVTGDVTVDGDGTFDGNVTADADGDPAVLGTLGAGLGTGLDLTNGASSRWSIVALTAAVTRVLQIADLLNLSQTYVAQFGLYGSGTGSINYSLVPEATTGVTLGEDASGKRLDQVHAKKVTASTAYYERLRTAAVGEWTNVTFAAGNFTGNNAMTWTVASGDQITFHYMAVGKTLFVNVYIDTSTVGGTPDTTLMIAIPGGFTAAKKVQNSCPLFDNGVGATGFARVTASGTVIEIGRMDGANFTASADNTYVRVMMAFEVT
jgi:hypothetical protein